MDSRVSSTVVHRPGRSQRPAFTLVELLTVMAVLAILASLLLAACGKARASSQSITCVNNLRQLQIAWLMYADDHTDTLPPNQDHFSDGAWRSLPGSWVVGNAQEDSSSTNIESGVLFPYIRALPIYHCPADRTRFSAKKPLNGAAFSGRVKDKTTRISNPVDVFVLLDASGWTINDGVFNLACACESGDANWYDDPSDRHSMGCNLTFADGRVGRLKWQWPKTAGSYATRSVNQADLHDLQRLQALIPEP